MYTASAPMGVVPDLMPRLTSVRADLEKILSNADRLRAARRAAIDLLYASDSAAVLSASLADEYTAFLDALLDIEQLAHEVDRTLDIW